MNIITRDKLLTCQWWCNQRDWLISFDSIQRNSLALMMIANKNSCMNVINGENSFFCVCLTLKINIASEERIINWFHWNYLLSATTESQRSNSRLSASALMRRRRNERKKECFSCPLLAGGNVLRFSSWGRLSGHKDIYHYGHDERRTTKIYIISFDYSTTCFCYRFCS